MISEKKKQLLHQLQEHSQGFSVCIIIKNPLNSPRITFNFQNGVVSMLYTLIEHATVSQSKSLLEWFK